MDNKRIEPRKGIHDDKKRSLSPVSSDASETDDNGDPRSATNVNDSPNDSRSNSKRKLENASPRTSSPGWQRDSKESLSYSTSRNIPTGFPLWGVVVSVLCLISALLIAFRFRDHVKEQHTTNCTYADLKNKYPQEGDNLWFSLKTGVDSILKDTSETISVFLFVHNGGRAAKTLIKDIAVQSSNCFDISKNPVEIEIVDFNSQKAIEDYGYVVELCKKKVKQGNVILIANLNEIPAEAARALHPICDVYSPLVPRVMILLSLTARKRYERPIDTAREALLELWGGKMAGNELEPLIARVTEQVIMLNSTLE